MRRVAIFVVLSGKSRGAETVAASAGTIVNRRRGGQPLPITILLNETTWEPAFQCYCGPAYPRTILVPRSLFFESRLYAYLNASNPISPLDKLAFRQNLTSAASNSDELQQILTGNVTTADVAAILDLLTRNGTNALVHLSMLLTNDLFLYSLPDGAVRLVGYDPPPTAYSWTYTFCAGSCAPTPKPWWELVWTGIVTTVVSFLTSAFVLAATAFAKLVEVLAQVGAWLWSAIVNAPATIASAVQAAGEVLEQLATWVVTTILRILEDALAGALAGINAILAALYSSTALSLQGSTSPSGSADFDLALDGIVRSILSIVTTITLIVTIVTAAFIAVKALTAGLSWFVETALAEGVVGFVVNTLLFTAFAFAATTLFTSIIEGMGWVEDRTFDFFASIGVGAAFVATSAKAAFRLYEALHNYKGEFTFAERWRGFAMSIFGFGLLLYGTLFVPPGVSRLVVDVASFALVTYGFYLYEHSRRNRGTWDYLLVKYTDFMSPITGKMVRYVTLLTPPIVGAKIGVWAATGGYD